MESYMLNRIREYFDDRAKKHEEEKLFEMQFTELAEAIRWDDGQTVSAGIEKVVSSPFFRAHHYDRLLRECFRADDTAIFSTVLGAISDKNYYLAKDPSSCRIANIHVKEHVLHAAIDAGSKNIALSLANNENISINDSGRRWISYPDAAPDVFTFAPPLEFAEEKGMHEVAAALAERIARDYSSRARKAKAKAEPSAGKI
jgi:hypothetical protein